MWVKLKRLLRIKNKNEIIHKPDTDGFIRIEGSLPIKASYPISVLPFGAVSTASSIHEIVEIKKGDSSKFYPRRKTTKGWVTDTEPVIFGQFVNEEVVKQDAKWNKLSDDDLEEIKKFL